MRSFRSLQLALATAILPNVLLAPVPATAQSANIISACKASVKADKLRLKDDDKFCSCFADGINHVTFTSDEKLEVAKLLRMTDEEISKKYSSDHPLIEVVAFVFIICKERQ